MIHIAVVHSQIHMCHRERMTLSADQATSLLNALPEGVFMVDMNRRIVFYNRSAEAITGVPAAQALNRQCSEVLRGDQCAANCPLERLLRTGERTLERTVQIVTRDGVRKTLSIATALYADSSGAITGAVETFRDLSHDRSADGSGQSSGFLDIVSINEGMQRLFNRLPTVAASSATVLITGETGTGKELFARALHTLSTRAGGPFVAVNCGALPDTLLEAELFGHTAGAFTDARQERRGRFARAEGGTIFLDEIGETSAAMQIKLLRVLENRTYEPVGSDTTVHANVRVVAATNRDLTQTLEQGTFRKDLYYRLNVVHLDVPPLRERRDDIPVLADFFIRRLNQQQRKRIRGLSDDAAAALLACDFPGNVRELENAIEYAFVMCPKGYIELQHLPDNIQAVSSHARADTPAPSLRSVEAAFLLSALRRNDGNYQATSAELGIHRTSLYRKLRKLGIKGFDKRNTDDAEHTD